MPARDLLRLLLAALALAMGLAGPAVAQTVQPTIAAGTAPAAITLNPVTGKVYVVNENSNDVTVLDGATGLTHSVTVGARPFWAAVNPETNKIYVSNFDDANVMILHGDTDTVSTTASTGGSGWIAIDPFLDKAFVVRFGAGDEFNIIDDETYANTAAERSYQPVAIAVNPVTHVIYLANQATGDITAVDGSVDAFYPTLYCPDGAGGFKPTPGQFDPDPGACINVPDTPVAVTVNPVTNLTYALSSSPSGQISVINGVGMANPSTFVSLTPPGVTEAAKAIAVNPVTNRIYAAFAGHIVVVDGATNGMTVIAAASPVAVGINVITNKIYVPNADGTLTVLDGDTNAATTIAIPTGAQAIAVNPVTNTMYVLNPDGVTPIAGAASDTIHTVPIATTIDALPGDASGPDATLTLHATSTFSPAALATVRKVYYQLDGAGPWLAASGSGPYTASFTGLATGPHTIRAYATNGLDAPSIMTDLQFNPIVGNTAAYAFTVGSAPAKVDPSVSLATSANPSNSGQSVTFTASVSGSAGAASGSVDFKDGADVITGCAGAVLASGSATCTTTRLAPGTRSITAAYSGDTHYNALTSAALSQVVNAVAATISTPAPGSTLGAASVTFTWNDAGASLYQLWVGSSVGADDYGFFPAQGTTTTSTTATGLPADGRTLYVRLYSNIGGTYYFRDFTYTAASGGSGPPTPTPASLTSPAPGSTLTGTSQLFQWNASGASLYQLWVGSTQGAYDVGYFPQSGTTGTSITATGLPTDGRTLYVRLYSAINGAWQFRDFTYTASGSGAMPPAPASLTSPTPGSMLTGTSQLFQWNASGASLYQLWVGSTQGAYDVGYFPQSGTTGTSVTATGLPTDGRTLYVRLYSAINGAWQFRDFTYTAAGSGGFTPTPATMSSPAPGSMLSGSSVTFNWNAASGASLYQLWVGTTPGAYDVGYFPQSGTTGTTATATGLPTDGRTLYVRLYTAIGNTWYFNDYTYQSGP